MQQKFCPQCHQVSDISAHQCFRCGHVFRTQFVSPTPIQAVPLYPPFSKRKKWAVGCCVAPVAAVILLLVVGSMFPHHHDTSCAIAVSCQAVRQQMKSPSSCQFPSSYEFIVLKEPDNRYFVQSYVDSQNSFGATIRTHFSCELKPNSEKYHYLDTLGPEGWTVLSLNFRD